MNVTTIRPLITETRQDWMLSVNTNPVSLSVVEPKPATKTMVSVSSISWLWVQMSAIYGKLFLSTHGVHDNGAWFETLKDLTPKALESGMSRLRNLSGDSKFSDYPPNCLQFKDLCLAFYESLKLPSASEALREIQNHRYRDVRQWSHAVVKFTAARLPADFFKNENAREVDLIFKEAYEKVCFLVKQGHDIPQIHEIKTPSIYAQSKPDNRAIGLMYLREMKSCLGIQSCAK